MFENNQRVTNLSEVDQHHSSGTQTYATEAEYKRVRLEVPVPPTLRLTHSSQKGVMKGFFLRIYSTQELHS